MLPWENLEFILFLILKLILSGMIYNNIIMATHACTCVLQLVNLSGWGKGSSISQQAV